ncbi:16066_t:CDS:2 [Cetraspora pellucida]|uniref:16066_t:CDS:1 n=1 Tax=Cetraspora pellucida TaxID=1433469 RepID=A0A9N9CID8_9GLOM|nr:16066_t:CDS:2 [Cetraspora pellucida]
MQSITQKKRISETYNTRSVAIIIAVFSLILIAISLSMIPYVPGDIKSDFYIAELEKQIEHLNTNQVLITNLSSTISSKNLIFIGDVHGSLNELKKLLKKIKYNSTNDHLVFVGDLVAKGPESIEVVRLVKELGSSCVRGNHDDKLIRWKGFLDILNKKRIKLKDYAKKNALPPHLKQDLYVVHAGLLPDVPFDQQDPYDMMNMNGRPTKSINKGHSWSHSWNIAQQSSLTPKTVIYGHDASRGLNIKEFTFGLDSRCVYGGELTALKWNEGKSIHSVSCAIY